MNLNTNPTTGLITDDTGHTWERILDQRAFLDDMASGRRPRRFKVARTAGCILAPVQASSPSVEPAVTTS